MTDFLPEFLSESLRTEGIPRSAINSEIDAVGKFLALPSITSADILTLAVAFQRDCAIRDKRGMNFLDRSRKALPGGPAVAKVLAQILGIAEKSGPYSTHVDFMELLPLTSHNGLVGRMIWLWGWHRLHQPTPQSFLRTWYRVSLDVGRMQGEK